MDGIAIDPSGEMIGWEGGVHFRDGAWEPLDDRRVLRTVTLGWVQPISEGRAMRSCFAVTCLAVQDSAAEGDGE